jgi:mycothiol synthase
MQAITRRPLQAQCYCYINPESNARTGRNEGNVGILGVRRGFRKIGLGKAMLLSGLNRLKQAGVETARLGVDANNPSGALRLYEFVGFQKVYTSINFVRDI